ncbi:MAG: thiamine ABC transporter substrate binding subunit [Candidatus Hermodarchaeota archaeon]
MRKFFQLIMPFILVFFILISTQNVSGSLNAISVNKSSRQANELVIYTYESLLAWGEDPEAVGDAVFTEFEQNEGITVKLEYFDDVGSMLVRLVEEKDDPQADIAIGIDNSMIHHAKEEGIFTPFYPTNLSDIPNWLYSNLDSDHFINPYDYGLIALIYHKDALNETLLPDPNSFVLDDLLNETLANMFVAEDPTTSSPGLGFLLWTVAVYDKILDQDWTSWWRQIAGKISIKESWGDAWALWATEGSGKHILVSYGTDAAYDYWYTGETPSIGVLLSHEGGQPNAWLQIEGIGIVNNTAHQEKAEKFVDWFLSKTVQEYIPENNWMFPANPYAELPDSYQYAVNLTGVNLLNDLIPPNELQEHLGTWMNAWLEAIYIPGFEAISVVFVFSFLGAIILVITRRNKKHTFK